MKQSQAKLLVVDDQPINIQTLHEIFKDDYQVFMATSGPQALAICQHDTPDLVILDIDMPGMGGFEVCAQLQADAVLKQVPVIFLTAHRDIDHETQGLALGAADFIAKPVNPAVVRARVKTHLLFKQQADQLRKLTFLDGLTGIYNRRYFDHQLAVEMARARRIQQPLGLVMIDIDHFKCMNNRYGHLAGDDCLRLVASTLNASLNRPADVLARFGGEEFVCMLPETDLAGAMAIAQLMEQQVRALGIPNEDAQTNPCVTLSLGVAVMAGDVAEDPASLLGRADAQLYEAKRTGRARVCGEVGGEVGSGALLKR